MVGKTFENNSFLVITLRYKFSIYDIEEKKFILLRFTCRFTGSSVLIPINRHFDYYEFVIQREFYF